MRIAAAFALLVVACVSAEKRHLRVLAEEAGLSMQPPTTEEMEMQEPAATSDARSTCKSAKECGEGKSCCQWNNAEGENTDYGQCGDFCLASFIPAEPSKTPADETAEFLPKETEEKAGGYQAQCWCLSKEAGCHTQKACEATCASTWACSRSVGLPVEPLPSDKGKETGTETTTSRPATELGGAGCWCDNKDPRCQSYDMCSSDACGNSGYACAGQGGGGALEPPSLDGGGVSGGTCTDTAPCSKGLLCCNWDNAAGAASKAGTCGEVCMLSVGEDATADTKENEKEEDEKENEKDNEDKNKNENESTGSCVQCGVGTVQRGDECLGISATCAGLWQGAIAYYRPTDPCQCNSKCGKFGNCCADYAHDHSTTAEGFCVSKNCPDYYEPKWDCQCNSQCQKFGNCCGDVAQCMAVH